MKYRINEIFYSLQGEGRNTGRAAIFIRFSGCNLKCYFCDTDFASYRELTAEEILEAIAPYPARVVVLTGGEPTLQADEELIDLLHTHGYYVAMESNGTNEAPKNIDWLTISPKEKVRVKEANEVKCIFTDEDAMIYNAAHDKTPELISDCGIRAEYYYLQPCDVGDPAQNAEITSACIDYIKQHPRWRLSLQTHKLLKIR